MSNWRIQGSAGAKGDIGAAGIDGNQSTEQLVLKVTKEFKV
jgi:hypothetical protein